MTQAEAYEAICYYTLSLGDVDFIHQHVVDAFAAQTAAEGGKPIGLTFALVGLFLHVEHGFSGREVQRAHMKLATARREWPRFPLPEHRGDITAIDVEQASAGAERDRMIDLWTSSVWNAFRHERAVVEKLLKDGGVLR